MTSSPNTLAQALQRAQAEAANPSTDWTGYCQKFVRTCWGIPPLFSSAWTQWQGADDEDRHVGGSPDDAPLGAALCFKGSGQYGHIELAARPFRDGSGAAWSNDLVRYGEIDKVLRTAAVTKWNQPYLGYLTAVNDYDLRLEQAEPPKPKHDKPYQAIDKAIANLERSMESLMRARATAKEQKDHADSQALAQEIRDLRTEIKDLHVLYARLRRA